MLRFSQSSSSSSSAATNHMDLSVLDRQRAVFQRLYQSDSDLHSVIDRQQLLSQFLHTDHQSQMATTSNSSLSMAPIPKPDWQCNSSLSPNKEEKIYSSNKKRKAEFDVEDEIKGKVVVEAVEEAGEEKSEITTKTERGISSNTCSKNSSKVKKPDYVHVRARRGQATDSHSLAERARREKISKKMKCLQDLVPGCHKVSGKAGMLDEIINYVQSLQKQVEFLSMKLATVNPRLDEMPAYIASLPAAAQFESTNPTCFHYNTMQQGCGIDMAMDPSPMLSQVFLDSSFISIRHECISKFKSSIKAILGIRKRALQLGTLSMWAQEKVN